SDVTPFSVGGDFTYNGHIAGDVNLDQKLNILDLTYVIDYIFRGGPMFEDPVEADVNADGTPGNILDLTYLIDHFFRGGPPPLHLDQ
ncbi:MAG: dockerin type I repeat-containing protein, partial [Candidatus Zixiibacteriota bacterium]